MAVDPNADVPVVYDNHAIQMKELAKLTKLVKKIITKLAIEEAPEEEPVVPE